MRHREHGISGLVVEYIVAIDVTRVRFPADACLCFALLHIQHTQITRNRGGRDSRCNALEDAIKIRVAIVMRYQKHCDSRGKGDSRGKDDSRGESNSKGKSDNRCKGDIRGIG